MSTENTLKKTEAGDLKERIRLLYRMFQDDGLGGHIATWSPGAEVWAVLVPLKQSRTAHESILSEARSPNLTCYQVRIRVGPVFGHPVRVQWGQRVLTVTTKPNIDPTHCWIDFLACEIREA